VLFSLVALIISVGGGAALIELVRLSLHRISLLFHVVVDAQGLSKVNDLKTQTKE
jgi:hypothetical protein